MLLTERGLSIFSAVESIFIEVSASESPLASLITKETLPLGSVSLNNIFFGVL